jgi:hypothetical protein
MIPLSEALDAGTQWRAIGQTKHLVAKTCGATNHDFFGKGGSLRAQHSVGKAATGREFRARCDCPFLSV